MHLLHLPSSEQLADVLAKGLTHIQHSYLVSKLIMKNLFTAPSLREGIEELTTRTVVL